MRNTELQTELDNGGCVVLDRTLGKREWIVETKGPKQAGEPTVCEPDAPNWTRAITAREVFATRKEALRDFADQGGTTWAMVALDGNYCKVMRLTTSQEAAHALIERAAKGLAANALPHLIWAARQVRADRKRGDRVWIGSAT